MAKRTRKTRPELSPPSLLFEAWREAATSWQQLRSDPAEARCRAARSAYYLAIRGEVPPIQKTTDEGDTHEQWRQDVPV